MLQAYLCVTAQYDLALVAAAALICLLTAWTTISLLQRGLAHRADAVTAWTIVAGVTAGGGIWATHFVAMLAYSPATTIGFEPILTLLSVVVAISGAIVALVIVTTPVRGRLWLGGVCFGMDVGAMHYMGMAAVRAPALMMGWNQSLVGVSLLLGIAIAAASFVVAFGGAAPSVGFGGDGLRRKLAATLLLSASICSLHFIGMAALNLVPAADMVAPLDLLPSGWIAVVIAGIALFILTAALAGVMVDSHLSRRTVREAGRLRTLADATFEGILIHAGGVVLDVNASLLELLGRERDELVGHRIERLFAVGHRNEASAVERISSSQTVETVFACRDGSAVPVEILGRAIEYQSTAAHVLAVRDITERRAAEQRIHHLAYHDALTELPNRRLFREHLQLSVARVLRFNRLAVLCLDLDRFKVVNDTLGHPAGDQLLCAVAARLQAAIRSSDVVARFGGDEFAIVQDFAADRAEQVTALCSRLVETLSAPFDIDGHLLSIGVSIGVAIAAGPELDADELLKNADLALYRAKAEGRGTWRFYEAEMDLRMQARHRFEIDLREALALDQFEVVYQPLVNVDANRISGFEALLRWHHPVRGTVSPVDFIPVAEEIGLIAQIGRWVLHRACTDAVRWPGTTRVAVNLSPAQFRSPSLAAEVGHVLAETGLDPARLELEVTESLLLGDDDGVMSTLHALHDLGVRIAMDDFGTGYSSLSYLRRFPFDKLKIDRSFVKGMSEDGADCSAIVRAIVGLGRSLGMTVNAEGVETETELSALRDEHCDEVQGFLFSRPVPVHQLDALMARFGTMGETTRPPPPALTLASLLLQLDDGSAANPPGHDLGRDTRDRFEADRSAHARERPAVEVAGQA